MGREKSEFCLGTDSLDSDQLATHPDPVVVDLSVLTECIALWVLKSLCLFWCSGPYAEHPPLFTTLENGVISRSIRTSVGVCAAATST